MPSSFIFSLIQQGKLFSCIFPKFSLGFRTVNIWLANMPNKPQRRQKCAGLRLMIKVTLHDPGKWWVSERPVIWAKDMLRAKSTSLPFSLLPFSVLTFRWEPLTWLFLYLAAFFCPILFNNQWFRSTLNIKAVLVTDMPPLYVFGNEILCAKKTVSLTYQIKVVRTQLSPET